MSKKKKVVVSKSAENTGTKTVPTTAKFKKEATSMEAYAPVFNRNNYMWMFAGIGCIIIGFLLMMGGSMPSPEVWDENIIYSFRRITLAPIFIIAGLVLGIYSIFTK